MTATGITREEEIPPRASVLVESLRDIGYSLQTAVADIIDNSLAAGAKKIELLADTHAEAPSIGILDDGAGMTRSELLEAMRPGSRSPLEDRSETDLGRFGLGLKTASFSQCRRLTVLTCRNDLVSAATWDLDTVAARDRWVVELPQTTKRIPWSGRLSGDGTLVVWEKLDRLAGADGRGDRQDLVRQLDETATHIEFVFHRFLSDFLSERTGSEGHVRILLNGRELRPFDPFHSHHPATQRHPEETFLLDGKEIAISPMTLPHHDKVSQEDWKRYAGQEGYVKNQGFYLYRNRRLIVHGTWFRLARQAELTKLSRVLVDMPNSLDSKWKVDVKKAWAQPPAPVRERLRGIVGGMEQGTRQLQRILVPGRGREGNCLQGLRTARFGPALVPRWIPRQHRGVCDREDRTRRGETGVCGGLPENLASAGIGLSDQEGIDKRG